MANQNKKNNYLAKRSEYRRNYLPFDYYDFWITAKENENLRFQNKLRDYLHTPFDWDEDQDFYSRSYEDLNKYENANQGTQTTARPNRHDHLKFNNANSHQNQVHPCDHETQVVNQIKAQKKSTKHSKQKPEETIIRPSKSASTQSNGKGLKPRRARSRSAKPLRRAESEKYSSNQSLTKPKMNKIKFVEPDHDSDVLKSKKFTSTLSSMAVQTPVDWKLRDYKNIRPGSSVSNKSALRSSSMANFQQKRPPFANYGWATKTKDLSLKPTHNALANKILANQDDEEAILELTLHKLKRDASSVANEYSMVESQVADHFQNFRSDSRAWNSEYDEKYPDYSKSALKKDIYFHSNPNRLTKSSLLSNYAPLRRGPRSAKKKIYYLE